MNKNEFQNRYASQRLNQLELDRKWRLHLREQEEMRMLMEAARAASASAVASGAGGAQILTGTGWLVDASIDTYSGANYVAQSMTTDGAGNIYSFSWNADVNEVTLLRKFSREGALLWEQTLFSDASEFYGRPERIRYSAYHDCLFVAYHGGIRALNLDGTLIWEQWIDENAVELQVVSMVTDSTGNLYLATQNTGGDTNCQIIQKRNGLNGSIINEITVYIGAGAVDSYINADIVIDSGNNLLVPIDYEVSNEYGTLLIKFDSNLEEVWHTSIFGTDYGNNDQDCTGFGIDANNNVYINGYGRGLTKIDSDGNITWALTTDQTNYGLGVDADGNTYVVGDDDGNGTVRVLKFNTEGNLLWGYGINGVSADLFMSDWNSAAYSKAQISGGRLLVTAALSSNTGKEVLLNLPLENITPGTYGEYVFTDITEWLVITPRTPSDAGMTFTIAATEDFVVASLTTSAPAIDQTLQLTSLE